ncbi:MAG: 4-aminobutyrate aminotransferase [Actinomycetota bacterium]|jgi:4-aminobutyrate aminotransferase|nr:4-aminobutyrate aminotransferase [Actinomycetota bacterium]
MSSLSSAVARFTSVRAVRGLGTQIFDDEGRRYLDMTAGIGVVSTGHCHPYVVAAVQRQAATLVHGQQTTLLHSRLEELADRLVSLTPPSIESFLFASAGTEAVEASLRLARHATGRTNVIAFQGGFHGRTAGALALTSSKNAFRAGTQPLPSGVAIAPFPHSFRYGWTEDETVEFCLREFDQVLETQSAPSETAAVIVEPVLGEGGYVPAPPRFLRELQARCNRLGILFIVDEVQTGIGRTGRMWALEYAGVSPDLLITAKGLASGYPLSAVGASRELMAQAWAGSQGGTYGGNAVSCAAALATLDVVESEGLVAGAAARGSQLTESLRGLQQEFPTVVTDVRGPGLMVAMEMAMDASQVRELLTEAERRGVLLLPCGPRGNVVRWIPPLVVTADELDEAVAAFSGALTQVAAAAPAAVG